MGKDESQLWVDVAATDQGQRLDRVLASKLPDLSRSRLKGLIEAGQVCRGTEALTDPNTRLRDGDRLRVTIPAPRPAEPQAQNIPLDIVYEDADVIVIDKQPGLVVHPAAGNPDGTLVNALLAHCGDSLKGIGGVGRPGIVHRIDKDTSGLMIAAKTERAMRSLGRQFLAHTVSRIYTCVVWGAPRMDEGTIEGNIARSPYDRTKMAIVRTGGKTARTHWRVLERYGRMSPIASLIECRLETGRTHQIRVHLSHIGHPLVGDPVYGRSRTAPRPRSGAESDAAAALAGFSRQALHAGVLGFQHPTSHKTLRFERAVPADMASLIKALRTLNKAP